MLYEDVFDPLTRDLYQICWKLIFFSEQLYEKMRQKLLSNPNFNIMAAYSQIDQTNKGHITASDVSSFLNSFLIPSLLFLTISFIFNIRSANTSARGR